MKLSKAHLVILLVASLLGGACQSRQSLELRIIHTTDVHSHLFPYDYVGQKPFSGGMARLSSLMREIRAKDAGILLLDAGDMLQGTPVAYYSNYIDTASAHAVLEAMNFLAYDATTIGNHDLEAGHRVYDRFVQEAKFPVLGANVISLSMGEPYFTPYKIFERHGAKIAVLGLTTPAVPQWLPEELWSGMRFEDIVATAKKWIPRIQETERPDFIVALIHSGLENNNDTYLENAGTALGEQVEGIDLILMGHDHQQAKQWVKRPSGDSVLLLNPANRLDRVGDVHIKIEKVGDRVVRKHIDADFVELKDYEADTLFLSRLSAYDKGVRDFLGRKIGLIDEAVVARDALFGPTPYMNVLHRMQLEEANAEISLAAPLALGASLPAGDIYVRDLFKWCPFSNTLYAMELTGAEIKAYLEYSYGQWANEMKSKDDHLIALRPDAKESDRYKTLVPTFDYSAAEGLNYVVDISKPRGERISISELSNGEPFDLNRRYRCAVNSYRAGGAGGLLTTGAGIPKEELRERIVFRSSHDQFYLLMKFFERKGIVSPRSANNWRFVPTAWAKAGEERSRAFIFDSSK